MMQAGNIFRIGTRQIRADQRAQYALTVKYPVKELPDQRQFIPTGHHADIDHIKQLAQILPCLAAGVNNDP
ncbi:hypothetical protein D3C76_1455800 [compost metagenome]